MAFSTLSTTTVLPETRLINPVFGVSSDSSDHGGAWCADVNRPDIFLSQQIRHYLDLQFRVRRATPGNCDRAQLERDHVRAQYRHIGDLVALRGGERTENGHRGAHGLHARRALSC